MSLIASDQFRIVVGLGKSGMSLVRFLAQQGVRFAVADTRANPPELETLKRDYPQVEVRCGERLFVIDAGTGIHAFGAHHGQNLPKRIDLLFSHLHLDHVTGLAFCKPAVLDREREIHTYCGNLDGASAAAGGGGSIAGAISARVLYVRSCG